MDEITVVGGGIAGLIAATEVAEAGAPVRVLEARSRLGGRAVSTPLPYVANFGPHALYTGTTLWEWLRRRGLHRPSRMPRSAAFRFRWRGELRTLPPREVRPVLSLRRAEAPVDRDFHGWLTERLGEDSARAIAGSTGALTFDHDPGRLSAGFVTERLQRITLRVPPTARYVEGGWQALMSRLAAHATAAGVRIETSARVDAIDDLGGGRVIVAVEPGAARRLLAQPGLTVESPRVALLDVALEHRRADPYIVVDLDEAAFFTRVTAVVPEHAPDGHELVQASVGLRPDEEGASGHARLEAVLDLAFPEWRERQVWRRVATVHESTGAIDLPGTTWRDRPAIAHADGVWLAGDWVAAPGHLAEVACNSAVSAAHAAVERRVRTPSRSR
jgi:glycine/D-amino acid oxidase-like deaminating enzyme